MAVRSGREAVKSLDDIGKLFSPHPSLQSSKEINMNSQNTSSAPAAAPSASNDTSALLAQALEQMRTARQELGQQVATAAAAANSSSEAVTKLNEKVVAVETQTAGKIEEITGRINNLEQAAAEAAKNATTTAKKPVYKRALDVAQQVGGIAACVGGIAYGGKLAYDHFAGQGDSANA